MEVQYIRNLMTSYMVVEQSADWSELTAWEQEMIAHSRIPQVIFADGVQENDTGKLWYDISGKQSLDTVLDMPVLTHKLLCTILTGIYEAVEKLESFLLRTDLLMLCPECIFLDYAGEQIYFCYGLKGEKPLPEAFCELMEYLLTRLDHTEERTLELAYGLYERSRKEGFCLSQLQELLRIDYEREKELEREEVMEEEAVQMCAHADDKIHLEKEERGGIIHKITQIEEKIAEVVGRWKDKIFHSHQRREGGLEEESFAFEPEEPEVKQSQPTVLISEMTREPEGILRYEGSGDCADLKIEGASYTIGSGETCEGRITSSTVSRKHARITRKEDLYFIEDLNSTNGTFVGGELLNYHVKMSLAKNETVVFADEKFRFI